MFNFSDTCFGCFFDAEYSITNDFTRSGARLYLLAQGGSSQSLRLSLVSASQTGAQAWIGIHSAAEVPLSVRLPLMDITPCAWRLPVTARPLTAQSLLAVITGRQNDRFQTVLRVREIERFTN